MSEQDVPECPPTLELLGSVGSLMNQLYGAISDEIGSTKPWKFAVLRASLARDEWTGAQLARLYPTNPSRK